MASFTFHIDKREQWEALSVGGPINEDAEHHLSEISRVLGPRVIINFRQVGSVNSCGVRAWINFMREAQKGRTIVFEECTPEIVNQINMIPNFKGMASVQSVYASYLCQTCDDHRWVLFEKGYNLPKTSSETISPPKCEKCGNPMEMDELEDEFFAWIDGVA